MNVLILGSGGREHALAWKTCWTSSFSSNKSSNFITFSASDAEIVFVVIGMRWSYKITWFVRGEWWCPASFSQYGFNRRNTRGNGKLKTKKWTY